MMSYPSLHPYSFHTWTPLLVMFICVAPSLIQTQTSSGGCGSCLTRSQKKELSVENFQKKLLDKLRLSAPPQGPHLNRRDLEKIPSLRAMIDDCEKAQLDVQTPRAPAPRPCHGPHCGHRTPGYDSMIGDDPQAYQSTEENEGEEEDSRTLVNVFQLPNTDRSSGSTVQFTVSEYTGSSSDLESVVFGVYVDESLDRRAAHQQYAFIYVYRNFRDGSWNGPIQREFIRKRRVALRPNGPGSGGFWVHFNLTQQTLAWMSQPGSNLGLYLEAHDITRQPLNILTLIDNGREQYRPYIQYQFRDPYTLSGTSRLTRQRRSHGQSAVCDETAQEQQCCRFPLILDFKAMGWDNWIISPKRASVSYCNGECPYLFHTAVGASYVARQTNSNLPGSACCSPTKLSPIKLLYVTQNGTYLQSELPDLVVEKCGCW